MKKTISVSQIKQAVNEAYDLYKNNQDGKNADYIPYLANIDKNLFGISVCLLDGQIIEVGDTQYKFGIESVSKVHTAILVLRQYGAEKLLSMIGADAGQQAESSCFLAFVDGSVKGCPADSGCLGYLIYRVQL